MVKVFVITSIVGLDSQLPVHWRLVKFPDSTQRDGEFYHELLGYTDVHYYVDIARYGYQAESERNAFYPLWPTLLRCGRVLTGQTFLVGMLLTNLLSLVGFLIFYQLCREESGKRCAGLALLLLICWPTGFFFFDSLYGISFSVSFCRFVLCPSTRTDALGRPVCIPAAFMQSRRIFDPYPLGLPSLGTKTAM